MNRERAATASTRSLARLEALAVRRGLSLGVLASSSPADFALMMAAAGSSFTPDETLSEREVNERLKAFLGAVGAMVAGDHVELRRWLVDNGVLARDGFGRAYTRGEPREEIALAMRELAGIDLGKVVADARERDATRRAERKRTWQASQ
jgi:Uncharacterized protein conserved in bacteria (DUF2087)